VLVARDKDFVPMIEKLNKQAIESALFWWDVPAYTVGNISRRAQRTAEILINTVTYHFEMTPIASKRKKTPLEDGIFYKGPNYTVPAESPYINTPQQHSYSTTDSNIEQVTEADTITTYPKIDSDTDSEIEPIENLMMEDVPRELTADELKKVYESVIISLNTYGSGGYVKGPVGFPDQTLNNFQFGVFDICDKQISDLHIGMRVQFRLKPDPKRTARLRHPFYRAYDITIA
jgi:hypothetical protein